MKPDDETLRTSWTLVARLKNVDDHGSWREFHGIYSGVIIGVAKKAGLRQEEAEDVLQETMASLSKNIRDFEANPARGSFRAWLLNMARWRIKDQLQKRLPLVISTDAPPDGTATTPTIESVPDAREADLEGLCDAEWKEQLMEQGLKELQLEVRAEHYQIFHLLAVEQKSVSEVSDMVGRSRAQIYLVKHRVSNALKRIFRRLEKRLG